MVLAGCVVAEQAVGQRSADPFVKEHEEKGDAGALGRELIDVPPTVPFQQAVGLHLPQVAAELGEGVALGREAEAGQEGLVNVGSAPAHHRGPVPHWLLVPRPRWLSYRRRPPRRVSRNCAPLSQRLSKLGRAWTSARLIRRAAWPAPIILGGCS